MPNDPVSAPSAVAGRYELQRLLGKGGMGTVWRGEDLLLRRPVAIKRVELPPHLPDDERDTIRQRVLREARAAARLNHPRLVTIFDVVEEDGTVFLVQELVDAPTLKDVVSERGPLPPARAAAIGSQLLDGLNAAHASGVVHRDVKPSNVMVRDDGSVKLADFGIASVQGDPNLTATGIIIGSPAYLAPEQATGSRVTAAADLWSLGATLYFAVEGEPPFGRADTISTLTAVVHDPPRRPLRAGPMSSVLDRLLVKEPDGRADAAETATLLARAEHEPSDDRTVAAAAVEPTEAMTRPVPVEVRAPAPSIRARSTAADQADRPKNGGRRGFPLGGVLAALIVLLLGALAFVALTAERDGDGTASDETTDTTAADTDDTTAPSTTGEPATTTTAEPAATTAPTTTAAVQVPAGWATHTDKDTGYVAAYPAGWQVKDRSGNRTDFVDPATGAYLRVDWTDSPGDDAAADWERQSDAFAQRHEGYEELGITRTTYKGSTNAALWEYRYRDGGATLHAYNLGFVLPSKSYGFALNFQASEGQWQAQQQTWEQLKAAFTPPA